MSANGIVLLDIPAAMQADGRTFSVIRSHNGTLNLLTDTDTDPATVTIETGDFSAYAIAYEGAAATTAAAGKAAASPKTNLSANTAGASTATAPKMGDPQDKVNAIFFLLMVQLLLAVVIRKTLKG